MPGVSRSNYYYWKRSIQGSNRTCDEHDPVIVRIDAKTFQCEQEDFVDLEAGNIRIRVTDRTPMNLLTKWIDSLTSIIIDLADL